MIDKFSWKQPLLIVERRITQQSGKSKSEPPVFLMAQNVRHIGDLQAPVKLDELPTHFIYHPDDIDMLLPPGKRIEQTV